MSRYLPLVDEYACAAHGDCEALAPDVFAVAEVAEVVGEGPPDLLLAAARACPAGAITIVDADSGETVYPR